ncbi:MAG: aspartyl protease [Candidatus Thermoplasmatota archaeon]|nr:aspartyl protease [Candidatus Thermoplasmatota archaeon]
MSSSPLIFHYFHYPIVPVKFYYKDKKTPLIDALLDSGGDFIVIPMPIARYLGLRLKKAGSVDTAGGATTLFKATTSMIIGKGKKTATYNNIQIHVSARNDIPVLLGRHPIFEDYEITFKKCSDQLILKLNANE